MILLFLIFLVFIVLAKVDYSIEGYGGYYPPQNVVQYHWFWQWTVGIPLMALAFTVAFWAGAPKTQRNRNIAVGIFLTTVFLIVGQLEDFLYFTVNSLPFPAGDWTWIWLYNVFGTWTTVMHFEWLAFWILLTCGMWKLILK